MPDLKILTFIDYYLPGFKAGGPIRTLANMVDKLGDEFLFKIITADRDIYDTKPYSGIRINNWNRVSKEEVYYTSPNRRSLINLKKLLCSTEYDVLYLNSFFSVQFTIKPLLLRIMQLIPDRPVILAPRGEFSPGALGLKSVKKHFFLKLAKVIGLYRGIIWQASSEHEVTQIQRLFGKDVTVVVAPNLPPKVSLTDELLPKSEKPEGCLKVIFLSRITRKKNLDCALKMLRGLKGKIKFSIYGPIEDKIYWTECEKIIAGLADNIDVRYFGSVAHDKVGTVFREHDLFFFPTLGENFGHVILEALCAGCPVLISDQTPWRDLEKKGVGWELPLNNHEMFQEVLQRCVDMKNEEYLKWSEKAQEYGLEVSEDYEVIKKNRNLFSRFISEE